MREIDLAVIGGGTAGFTAGLFGARYGLDTLVLERSMPGGQIINVERIENYPGFPKGISGAELAALAQRQAMQSGCTVEMAEVIRLVPQDRRLALETSAGPLSARAVIVATGSSLRRLGVPGEEDHYGRGVSQCATCDGPFFNGEVVGIVGGGDSAADEALTLTRYAARVIVFQRRGQLRAQHVLRSRLLAHPKIEMHWHTEVREVLGGDNGRLRAVRVWDAQNDQEHSVDLAALFVFVGLDPNSAFLRGVVDLDNAGHVPTDVCMRTSVPGVFAAGDIRQHSAAQVASSVGDAATAAISAAQYIQSCAWA